MRNVLLGLSLFATLISACTVTTTSPTTTEAQTPAGCIERCEAAAAKCGGADQAFCADACGKYTEAQLTCMEAAGCNSARIAACTAGTEDSGPTPDDTGSPPADTGTTAATRVSCASWPMELDSGEVCATTCREININGRDFCAKPCTTDADCSSSTRCTVKGSSRWCAKTCTSSSGCKSYGFTTCASGYTADSSDTVCAY